MSNKIVKKNFKTFLHDLFQSERHKKFVVKGHNNIITAKNPKKARKIRIHLYGNNNEITINTEKRFVADIIIGSSECPVNNCKIFIDEDSTAEDLIIRMIEDNLELSIGKDCMISSDVQIFCSDIHTIHDQNNNILNRGGHISIGNHVWLGFGVFIAKKSIIADNCIVGMKSVVAGKFEQQNSVLVGNPAKIIKTNINWNRLSIKHFENKHRF